MRNCSQDQFDSYRESTIGAAFLTQTISLDENTTVKFEIWDTAGQERYQSLAPMYYRNANCAVVVYDITQSVRHLFGTRALLLKPNLPLACHFVYKNSHHWTRRNHGSRSFSDRPIPTL